MKNEGGRKRNIRVQRRESERPRELTLFVWRDRPGEGSLRKIVVGD